MRTTLTIDDDVASRIKQLMARKHLSLKDAVNELLRRGLAAQQPSKRPATRFEVKSFKGAFRSGVDLQRLNQLVDELEVRRLSKA